MIRYFRPVPRAVGVLALIAACVFTVGWVKSLMEIEIVIVPISGNRTLTLFSEDQWFGAQYHHEPKGFVRKQTLKWLTFVNVHHTSKYLLTDNEITWHYRFRGFGFAEYLPTREKGGRFVFWIFPYWSAVIPLTVLSICLLPSKRRNTANPPTPDQPQAE